MRPSDFRVRTLDGVADDWPVDYTAPEPWFALNHRIMTRRGAAQPLLATATATVSL